VVWHAGVRGRPGPEVAHHNLHFGREWEAAFRSLFDEGRCMRDPSTLVTVPTVTDPTLAPAGDSVVYALEPVPNLAGRVDWRVERSRARDRLAHRLAAAGYPGDVAVEALVDPHDWAAAGLSHGTPFGLAHRFLQTGPFRPANLERRAPGLVFVGAGTVPGIGVPMVLVSGRLAADRVEGR
jgi:phytoene desaturase